MPSPMSKEKLLAYLDRVERNLGKLHPFAMLDVPKTATPSEIRSAFQRLATRLHPDLYRNILSPSDVERTTRVYAKIANSYQQLKTPHTKQKLLDSLASTETVSQNKLSKETTSLSLLSPKAQRAFRRAEAAMRRGETSSAMLHIRMALAESPESSFLRIMAKQIKKKMAV